MPSTGRIASTLYDNPSAQVRNAARGRLEQVQERQQREATAQRDRAAREMTALNERHAQEHARYGNYRPPDNLLSAQRAERIELRQRHSQAAERLAERHERELKQARRK